MRTIHKTKTLPSERPAFARMGALCIAALCIALSPRQSSAAVDLKLFPTEGAKGEIATFQVKFVIGSLPAGTALQFDVAWNDQVISSVTPALTTSAASTHTIDSASIGDHAKRVVIYSLQNANIAVEGLLTLQSGLAHDVDTENRPFTISNVLLSDASSQAVDIESEVLVFYVPKTLETTYQEGKTKVALTWTGHGDAQGYELYRGATNDFDAATLIEGDIAEEAYTDASIVRARYYYWVSASYADGESSPSLLSEIAPVPDTPGQFVVTDSIHPSKATLAWLAAQDTDTVELFRSIGASFEGAEKIATLETATQTYTDANGVSGIPYFYWARGVNEFGPGPATESDQGIAAIASTFENTQLRAQFQGNGIGLTWLSKNGGTYRLAYSNDLKTWQLLPESFAGNGAAIQWDSLEEADISYPAFFQTFAVEQ